MRKYANILLFLLCLKEDIDVAEEGEDIEISPKVAAAMDVGVRGSEEVSSVVDSTEDLAEEDEMFAMKKHLQAMAQEESQEYDEDEDIEYDEESGSLSPGEVREMPYDELLAQVIAAQEELLQQHDEGEDEDGVSEDENMEIEGAAAISVGKNTDEPENESAITAVEYANRLNQLGPLDSNLLQTSWPLRKFPVRNRTASLSELDDHEPRDWYDGKSLSADCLTWSDSIGTRTMSGDSITYVFMGRAASYEKITVDEEDMWATRRSSEPHIGTSYPDDDTDNKHDRSVSDDPLLIVSTSLPSDVAKRAFSVDATRFLQPTDDTSDDGPFMHIETRISTTTPTSIFEQSTDTDSVFDNTQVGGSTGSPTPPIKPDTSGQGEYSDIEDELQPVDEHYNKDDSRNADDSDEDVFQRQSSDDRNRKSVSWGETPEGSLSTQDEMGSVEDILSDNLLSLHQARLVSRTRPELDSSGSSDAEPASGRQRPRKLSSRRKPRSRSLSPNTAKELSMKMAESLSKGKVVTETTTQTGASLEEMQRQNRDPSDGEGLESLSSEPSETSLLLKQALDVVRKGIVTGSPESSLKFVDPEKEGTDQEVQPGIETDTKSETEMEYVKPSDSKEGDVTSERPDEVTDKRGGMKDSNQSIHEDDSNRDDDVENQLDDEHFDDDDNNLKVVEEYKVLEAPFIVPEGYEGVLPEVDNALLEMAKQHGKLPTTADREPMEDDESTVKEKGIPEESMEGDTDIQKLEVEGLEVRKPHKKEDLDDQEVCEQLLPSMQEPGTSAVQPGLMTSPANIVKYTIPSENESTPSQNKVSPDDMEAYEQLLPSMQEPAEQTGTPLQNEVSSDEKYIIPAEEESTPSQHMVSPDDMEAYEQLLPLMQEPGTSAGLAEVKNSPADTEQYVMPAEQAGAPLQIEARPEDMEAYEQLLPSMQEPAEQTSTPLQNEVGPDENYIIPAEEESTPSQNMVSPDDMEAYEQLLPLMQEPGTSAGLAEVKNSPEQIITPAQNEVSPEDMEVCEQMLPTTQEPGTSVGLPGLTKSPADIEQYIIQAEQTGTQSRKDVSPSYMEVCEQIKVNPEGIENQEQQLQGRPSVIERQSSGVQTDSDNERGRSRSTTPPPVGRATPIRGSMSDIMGVEETLARRSERWLPAEDRTPEDADGRTVVSSPSETTEYLPNLHTVQHDQLKGSARASASDLRTIETQTYPDVRVIETQTSGNSRIIETQTNDREWYDHESTQTDLTGDQPSMQSSEPVTRVDAALSPITVPCESDDESADGITPVQPEAAISQQREVAELQIQPTSAPSAYPALAKPEMVSFGAQAGSPHLSAAEMSSDDETEKLLSSEKMVKPKDAVDLGDVPEVDIETDHNFSDPDLQAMKDEHEKLVALMKASKEDREKKKKERRELVQSRTALLMEMMNTSTTGSSEAESTSSGTTDEPSSSAITAIPATPSLSSFTSESAAEEEACPDTKLSSGESQDSISTGRVKPVKEPSAVNEEEQSLPSPSATELDDIKEDIILEEESKQTSSVPSDGKGIISEEALKDTLSAPSDGDLHAESVNSVDLYLTLPHDSLRQMVPGSGVLPCHMIPGDESLRNSTSSLQLDFEREPSGADLLSKTIDEINILATRDSSDDEIEKVDSQEVETSESMDRLGNERRDMLPRVTTSEGYEDTVANQGIPPLDLSEETATNDIKESANTSALTPSSYHEAGILGSPTVPTHVSPYGWDVETESKKEETEKTESTHSVSDDDVEVKGMEDSLYSDKQQDASLSRASSSEEQDVSLSRASSSEKPDASLSRVSSGEEQDASLSRVSSVEQAASLSRASTGEEDASLSRANSGEKQDARLSNSISGEQAASLSRAHNGEEQDASLTRVNNNEEQECISKDEESEKQRGYEKDQDNTKESLFKPVKDDDDDVEEEKIYIDPASLPHQRQPRQTWLSESSELGSVEAEVNMNLQRELSFESTESSEHMDDGRSSGSVGSQVGRVTILPPEVEHIHLEVRLDSLEEKPQGQGELTLFDDTPVVASDMGIVNGFDTSASQPDIQVLEPGSPHINGHAPTGINYSRLSPADIAAIIRPPSRTASTQYEEDPESEYPGGLDHSSITLCPVHGNQRANSSYGSLPDIGSPRPASETRDEAIETDFSTQEYSDELERLRKERQRILDMLAKDMMPSKLQVELAEAQLNYIIGQTDTLLSTIDEPWDWDAEWLQEISAPEEGLSQIGKEYLAKYRSTLEQSRAQIEERIRLLETERERKERSRERSRKMARFEREAQIEAFTLEREREQASYEHTRLLPRSRSDSPAFRDRPVSPADSFASIPNYTPPKPLNAKFLTPKQRKDYLISKRRGLVKSRHNERPRSVSPATLAQRSLSPIFSYSTYSSHSLPPADYYDPPGASSYSLYSTAVPSTDEVHRATTTRSKRDSSQQTQEMSDTDSIMSALDDDPTRLLGEYQRARGQAESQIQQARQSLQQKRVRTVSNSSSTAQSRSVTPLCCHLL